MKILLIFSFYMKLHTMKQKEVDLIKEITHTRNNWLSNTEKKNYLMN